MTTPQNGIPSITQEQFDEITPKLTKDLRRWYREYKLEPAPLSPKRESTAGAFEHVPDIDSKAVVTASGVVQRHLGVGVDAKHIRKGGYQSFEDFCNDYLPKLRASCPTRLPGSPATAMHGGV